MAAASPATPPAESVWDEELEKCTSEIMALIRHFPSRGDIKRIIEPLLIRAAQTGYNDGWSECVDFEGYTPDQVAEQNALSARLETETAQKDHWKSQYSLVKGRLDSLSRKLSGHEAIARVSASAMKERAARLAENVGGEPTALSEAIRDMA